MKTFLFLIAAFLFINMAMAAIKQKRAVTAEPIVFEVEVRAPCEAYLPKVLSSIQISSFSSPGCLPINLTNPTTDINDRNSHVFCRNIDFDTRSIFYFHEIFPGTNEDETPAPGEIFIVSWISPVHFIERGRQYTYLRRPDCNVEDDLCSNLTIVGYCKDKPVSFLNGYVATTDDRIYFIPPNAQVGTCTLNDKCCPYVNTLPTGICGGLGDACSFLDCNDGLICTDDSCSQGRCMHDPVCKSNDTCFIATCDTTNASCGAIPKCSTTDVCKSVVCTNGACSYPDKCTSADPCKLPTCNATGDCGLTDKCTSNNPCKAANCYANGTCYFTDTCISTNSCLIATCNTTDGYCNITEKCTSNDPCKAPGCYANGTCYLTDTCVPTNSCMIATCNSTDGSCKITPKCVDPDLCTIASCNAGTCTFTPKNCSDSLFCTTNERCNVTDGQCYSDVTDCSGPMSTDKCILSSICNKTSDSCQYTNVTCPADNMCYKDSQCNANTGVCAYQNIISCDDKINCTRDSCDNSTGCIHTPKCTSDGDPCTVDYCIEASGGRCGGNIYCYETATNCQKCQCLNTTLCSQVNDSIIYTTSDAYNVQSDIRFAFYCNTTCPTKRKSLFAPVEEKLNPNDIELQDMIARETQKFQQQKELEEENRKIQIEKKEKTSQEKVQKKKSWWNLWK